MLLNGTSRQVQAVFIAQLVAFTGFCLSGRHSQPVTVMETVCCGSTLSRSKARRWSWVGSVAMVGVFRDLRRLDRRVPLGPCRGRVVILEQQWSQPPPHVPFHVIGQHAQEDMAAHMALAVDVDRADPQVILARAEGAFHAREALVRLHGSLGH